LISRKDKNKHPLLLSQCKLAFTGKKYVNGSVNSEISQKIKKPGAMLLQAYSISIHICYQKPNTAFDTVPFRLY
jgi:hypothetical protein